MNSHEKHDQQLAVPKNAAAFAPQTLEVLETKAVTVLQTAEIPETEAATLLQTTEVPETKLANVLPPIVGAPETILAPEFDPADAGAIRLVEISTAKAQKSTGKLAAWQVWGLRAVLFLPLIAIVLTIFGIPTAIVRTIDSWLNPAPPLVPPANPVETVQPQPIDNVKKIKQSSRPSGTR